MRRSPPAYDQGPIAAPSHTNQNRTCESTGFYSSSRRGINDMRRACVFAVLVALLLVGIAGAQFPVIDLIAEKVTQKYAQSTCEQLWEARGKPKSAQEQEFIHVLRTDAQMRTAFINKIAAPVANKMFECGLIP